MYPASINYQAATYYGTQFWHVRGTAGGPGGTTINDDYIIAGSMEFSNQASDASDIILGARFIGELTISIERKAAYNLRNQWIGTVLNLEIGLATNRGRDEDIEWIPLTPYTVTEAEWDYNGVHLKAVDNMAKFDKAATFTVTGGSLYALLSFICGKAGVELGMTEAQLRDFPNGTRTLALDPNGQGSIKTYRDMLSWLAQAAASFATIDRQGRLVLRRFTRETTDADIQIRPFKRYQGGTWSDFKTKYTGISIVDSQDNETKYYHVDPDDGLTMNLGSNPFLQLGLRQAVREMREEILNEVVNIQWIPFDITTVPDATIDLGDVVDFFTAPNFAQSPKGMVMGYTYKLNSGLQIEGFGKNPALTSVQSKVDKQIAGIMSNMSNTVVHYFSYENAETLNVGTAAPVRAATIAFGNSAETDVDIWHEFKYTADVTDSAMKVYAYYYLDDVLQDYQPVDTISEDGEHILGLHFHIGNLAANGLHSWRVDLKTAGGTAEILPGDAHVVLSGVNLGAGSEWDGRITVEDRVPLYVLNGISAVSLQDSINITRQVPQKAQFSDQVPGTNINGVSLVGVTDQMYIEVLSPEWFQHADEGLYASTDDSLTTGLI